MRRLGWAAAIAAAVGRYARPFVAWLLREALEEFCGRHVSELQAEVAALRAEVSELRDVAALRLALLESIESAVNPSGEEERRGAQVQEVRDDLAR